MPSCLAAQAIRQEGGNPLLPPNLITTGDANRNTVIVGFSIASLPDIPFSATIEAETKIVDASGNTTFRHRITKIARDSKGRTRIDTDLNAVGAPTDPRLVTVHIYDAVAKADITLFPWHQSAIRLEYEDDSPPSLDVPEPPSPPAPIALEPPQSQLQIDIQREELGLEVIEGMQLRHGRETSRYPAGFAGYKDVYTVVIDYWYSQKLQSFVLVKQRGPSNSVHTLTLRNIRRESPDPSLFTIPNDYKVQNVHMEAPKTIYEL
jgi:hypothetical protein